MEHCSSVVREDFNCNNICEITNQGKHKICSLAAI